jgi:chemotaxis protein methyltransferase CheR
MRDDECVAFLQWALPRLGLRWPGFRRVRRQVCRRIARRVDELGLADGRAYRAHLEAHPGEWALLDRLCRVTISRFWRDRAVFETLRDVVLPALGPAVLAWSVGCASGEEPYSLVLAAADAEVVIDVLATDVDPVLLDRARAACYTESSLHELPARVRACAFDDGCLKVEHRERVTFRLHDVRDESPEGPFDLVLCRNLAFTYFSDELQHSVASRLRGSLRPGGALVVGAHESLPEGMLEPWLPAHGVWCRGAGGRNDRGALGPSVPGARRPTPPGDPSGSP